MASTKTHSTGSAALAAGLVDADVHNTVPTPDALKRYLPKRWHREYDAIHVFPFTAPYDSRPLHNGPWRADVNPPSGLLPGADLDFLREQLLEEWNIRAAVLSGLELNYWPAYGEFGAALTRALNDWNDAEWINADARLYGSIAIPVEDARLAVAEIERLADNRRFVQVFFLSNTREPLGHPKYWPVYEAAAAAGLPVGVHVGGNQGTLTGAGWPTYYFEQRNSFLGALQAHVISLVNSRVLERIPDLQIVWIEGTFAWLPSLMWRLDRAWKLLRRDEDEPAATPSELIRRHFWVTTQPMDDVRDPAHFMLMLEHLGMDDRILFASDYPHWDFDAPDKAFPPTVKGELREMIFARNGASVFRLDG